LFDTTYLAETVQTHTFQQFRLQALALEGFTTVPFKSLCYSENFDNKHVKIKA